MKRSILGVGIMIVFVLSASVYGQTPPVGIGGLKWGDSTEKFDELKDPVGFGLRQIRENVKIGRRWISLGDVSHGIDPPIYYFYKEKFCSFTFGLKDKPKEVAERKFRILKESIIAKYGDPKEEVPLVSKINPSVKSGVHYRWDLDRTVWIVLEWNELSEEGSLTYDYLPIFAEQFKEEKRQEKESIKKTKDSL